MGFTSLGAVTWRSNVCPQKHQFSRINEAEDRLTKVFPIRRKPRKLRSRPTETFNALANKATRGYAQLGGARGGDHSPRAVSASICKSMAVWHNKRDKMLTDKPRGESDILSGERPVHRE
jgi:hypothetical protein